MKKTIQKRSSPTKVIFGILGCLVLAAVLIVLAVGAVLMSRYKQLSYEYQQPVERESEYVRLEYPEIIITPDAEWMEDDISTEETVWETETEAADHIEVPDTVECLPDETEPAEILPVPDVPEETEEYVKTDDGLLTENVPNYVPSETVKETEKSGEKEDVPAAGNVSVPVPVETEKETVKETKPETVYVPPETLPQVVTPSSAPETKPAETVKYDPNASFANSQNAVSVYGKIPIYKVQQKDTDIVNILVLGTDSKDVTLDRGRSDTMIVVSYNSGTGEIKLTSLLRDSLVYIEGVGWNRINTAYFYGGVGLAVNTVNQLYDLDIQQFVVIDFNGVKNFIDYIGGAEVTLTAEEAAYYTKTTGKQVSEGLNRLNSDMALRHMRNRTIGNDFGRTQRQRDVMTAVVKQIFTQKNIVEIYDIINYSISLIKTNISATDLVSLAASIAGNVSKLSISSQNVPYDDAYQFARYNGMSIISYDIDQAAKRLNQFIYGK